LDLLQDINFHSQHYLSAYPSVLEEFGRKGLVAKEVLDFTISVHSEYVQSGIVT